MEQVQTILQELVAKLLLGKPEDPVPNIIQLLEDSMGNGTKPLSKEEKIELDELKGEYAKLKEKQASLKINVAAASDSDNDKSSSDSEYLDEVNDDLSPTKHQSRVL